MKASYVSLPIIAEHQ